MRPIYRRELNIQGGVALSSILLASALVNERTVSNVAKVAMAILIPFECLRIAFLLKALDEKREEVKELSKRPTEEKFAALAKENRILKASQMPEGAIHTVQIVEKNPSPKLYQQMQLAKWVEEGSSVKRLEFKLKIFPEKVLDVCDTLIELRLGVMSVPDFSKLMEAVEKSGTLQVFQVSCVEAPTKEEIIALENMLKNNQSLTYVNIILGVKGADKSDRVCLQEALTQSRITICHIGSGKRLVGGKNKETVQAPTIRIPMRLPPTLLEKASEWLVNL